MREARMHVEGCECLAVEGKTVATDERCAALEGGPEPTPPPATHDLITWLRAQLDDDERVAREAGDDCMRWHYEGLERNLVDDLRMLAIAPYEGTLHEAEHIARWDPARVLAEVEAKRQMLLLWEFSSDAKYPDDVGGHAWAMGDVVKLLALPYADRPGYREEWRPSAAS